MSLDVPLWVVLINLMFQMYIKIKISDEENNLYVNISEFWINYNISGYFFLFNAFQNKCIAIFKTFSILQKINLVQKT